MNVETSKIAPEHYLAYEGFIHDGQIELHEVPTLLEANPEFAAWLKQRHVLRAGEGK